METPLGAKLDEERRKQRRVGGAWCVSPGGVVPFGTFVLDGHASGSISGSRASSAEKDVPSPIRHHGNRDGQESPQESEVSWGDHINYSDQVASAEVSVGNLQAPSHEFLSGPLPDPPPELHEGNRDVVRDLSLVSSKKKEEQTEYSSVQTGSSLLTAPPLEQSRSPALASEHLVKPPTSFSNTDSAESEYMHRVNQNLERWGFADLAHYLGKPDERRPLGRAGEPGGDAGNEQVGDADSPSSLPATHGPQEQEWIEIFRGDKKGKAKATGSVAEEKPSTGPMLLGSIHDSPSEMSADDQLELQMLAATQGVGNGEMRQGPARIPGVAVPPHESSMAALIQQPSTDNAQSGSSEMARARLASWGLEQSKVARPAGRDADSRRLREAVTSPLPENRLRSTTAPVVKSYPTGEPPAAAPLRAIAAATRHNVWAIAVSKRQDREVEQMAKRREAMGW
ncbi:MAG: hypothetical protein M1832_005991 [Thelocarpon impressellum]|nr:MAG: hypothetical protein M1832_005991 [Thelocarpon impressellum]